MALAQLASSSRRTGLFTVGGVTVSEEGRGRLLFGLDVSDADRTNPAKKITVIREVSENGIDWRQNGGFTWQGNSKTTKTSKWTRGPLWISGGSRFPGEQVRWLVTSNGVEYSAHGEFIDVANLQRLADKLMLAVAWVQTDSDSGEEVISGTSITITITATTGNLLDVSIAVWDSDSAAPLNHVVSDGINDYTRIGGTVFGSDAGNDTAAIEAHYARNITGGTLNVTVTPGDTLAIACAVTELSGVDFPVPIPPGDSATNTGTSGTAVTSSSVTPDLSGVAVAHMSYEGAATTMTPNWTSADERAEVDENNDAAPMNVLSKTVATGVAENAAWTLAASRAWAALIRCYRQAVPSTGLQFAHGAIQWLAADAINTVYTVSGLAFAPRALRFYAVGLQNAADAVSGAVHSRRSVGFATSVSSRRCVISFDQDAAATSVCATAALSDCVAAQITTATIDSKLDLNSITADGFTLIVDDQAANNMTVFWEAWGGDDITNVTVGDIAEPAAIGQVSYTATGFAAGATDQVVMTAGVQSTAAVGSALAEHSGLCVGFAGGSGASKNWMVVGGQDHASGTADTDGSCLAVCLGMITPAGGDLTAKAQLHSTPYGTDLFTIDWTNRATTSRRSIYMAIKGGSWVIGNLSIEGQTLNNTSSVSGLAFVPIGGCLLGRMSAVQSLTTTAVQDRISIGTFSSTSSRRSMGHLSEDASTSGSSVMEVSLGISYEYVLYYPGGGDLLVTRYDVSAMAADGFTLRCELAGGVTDERIGYLTFGNSVHQELMGRPYGFVGQNQMQQLLVQ